MSTCLQSNWSRTAAAVTLLIVIVIGATVELPAATLLPSSAQDLQWIAPPIGIWGWDATGNRFYKQVPSGSGKLTDYCYANLVGGKATYDLSNYYRSFVAAGSNTVRWVWYNHIYRSWELLPMLPNSWDQTNPTVFNRSAQRFERITTDSSGKKWTDIIFLTQDRKAPDYGKMFRWYNQAECPSDKIMNHWYWFSGNTWVDYEQPTAVAPLAWNGLKTGSWNFFSKRFEMLGETKIGTQAVTYIDVYFPKGGTPDPNQHWRWYTANNVWTWYNPTSKAWENGKTQTVWIKNTRAIATLVNVGFGGGVGAHKWTEFDLSANGLNVLYMVGADGKTKTIVDPNGKWTLYSANAVMVCELAAGASTTITYRFNHPTAGGDGMLFMSKETSPTKPYYDGYDKYDANNPLAIWGAGNMQLDCMQTRFEWNLYRWLPVPKKYGDGAFNLSMVNGYNGGLIVNSLDYNGVSKTLFNAQHMFQRWGIATDRTYGLGSDWATWPWKAPYEFIFTNPTDPKYCSKTGQPYEFRVADPYAPTANNIGVKWDSANNHWTGLDAPGVEYYSDTSIRTLSVFIGSKTLITGFIQRAGKPPIVKLAGGWLMEPRQLNLGIGWDIPSGDPVGWIDPRLGAFGTSTYWNFSTPYQAYRYVPVYLNGHLFFTPSQLGLLALLP